MANRFSDRSRGALATAHPKLRELFATVLTHWDCTVIEGVRTEERQRELVRTGKSRTMRSKHLKQDDGYAHAVDVMPHPIDWEDWERNRAFGGFVLGMAAAMGIRIRWGGDWDGDREFKDQRFVDLPHFELVV